MLLTGNLRLDSLHQAGRVEGGDDSGGDRLQEQVLADTAQAGMLVNFFGPGSYLEGVHS